MTVIENQSLNINSLYLSYDGLTDPLGQSQILPYLLGLEEKGITFYIISFEKREAFKKNEKIIRKLIAGRNIHWTPFKYINRPPVLSTIYNLRLLWDATRKLVETHDIQVVHCRSYVTSLIGLRLKYKFGLEFFFDMRGFWADERVEGNLWDLKNPVFNLIYRFFKRKEKEFFLHADAIISLTDNAKEEIPKILSESPQLPKSLNQKIKTIPCCTDLTLFNRSRLSKALKTEVNEALNGSFAIRFIYIGSLGTWYMLKEMLDFFECILQNGDPFQFVFLTNDDNILFDELTTRNWQDSQNDKKLFKEPVKSFHHKNFLNSEIVITKAERSLVPYFIDYCDASILFIKPSFSKKASSATKMGEALAMNKPVITNTNWGDVDYFSSICNSILLVNEFSPASYQKTMLELDSLIENTTTDAFVLAKERLSLEYGIDEYLEIYKMLS